MQRSSVPPLLRDDRRWVIVTGHPGRHAGLVDAAWGEAMSMLQTFATDELPAGEDGRVTLLERPSLQQLRDGVLAAVEANPDAKITVVLMGHATEEGFLVSAADDDDGTAYAERGGASEASLAAIFHQLLPRDATCVPTVLLYCPRAVQLVLDAVRAESVNGWSEESDRAADVCRALVHELYLHTGLREWLDASGGDARDARDAVAGLQRRLVGDCRGGRQGPVLSLGSEWALGDAVVEVCGRWVEETGLLRSPLSVRLLKAGSPLRQLVNVVPMGFGRLNASPLLVADYLMGLGSAADLATAANADRATGKDLNELAMDFVAAGVDVCGPDDFDDAGFAATDAGSLALDLLMSPAHQACPAAPVVPRGDRGVSEMVETPCSPPSSPTRSLRRSMQLSSPRSPLRSTNKGAAAGAVARFSVMSCWAGGGGSFLVSVDDGVGQPSGCVLIDGGFAESAGETGGCIQETEGRVVDVIIVSSPRPEHVGGIAAWVAHRRATQQSLPARVIMPHSLTSVGVAGANAASIAVLACTGVAVAAGATQKRAFFPSLVPWPAVKESELLVDKYGVLAPVGVSGLPHHGCGRPEDFVEFFATVAPRRIIATGGWNPCFDGVMSWPFPAVFAALPQQKYAAATSSRPIVYLTGARHGREAAAEIALCSQATSAIQGAGWHPVAHRPTVAVAFTIPLSADTTPARGSTAVSAADLEDPSAV